MSDDDILESRLRRALSSEASMVHPAGDGLARIREGIQEREARRWWKHPAFALAAAAVLGIAAAGIWWSGGDGGTTVSPPGGTSSASSTPSGTTEQSQSPTPSSSPTGTAGQSSGEVFVYFIGADPRGPKLFREEHSVVGSGGKAKLALERMFRGRPDDPDYATPWDSTTLLSYDVHGSTATVDLSSFVSVGSEFEQAAVQELVYTVTANDKAVRSVLLRVNGRTPDSGHLDLSQPVSRKPMLEVQAQTWILAPKQDATVGSPVQIDGYGTAFEGNFVWEVRKAGVLVKQGHMQGGSNGVFGEFHADVTLAAGDYELTVQQPSAQDGSPTNVDTKNFTVR